MRAMAVAATGSRKPDRRAARLLPGLRLRCCDKAVLPSAMHSGAGCPGCGPLRGRAARRVMAFGVLPGPAPGGARAHGRPPLAIGDTLPEGQVGFLRIRGKSCVAPPLLPSVQITERQHVSTQLPSVIFS